MKIYTGGTQDPDKMSMMEKYDMGIMISSTPSIMCPKGYSKFSCALDNGAFGCFYRGFPFQEDVFMDTMRTAFRNGVCLDFIICPDIVCGGIRSLDFSRRWSKKLEGCPNLALAVQDGMMEKDITSDIRDNFSYIFVGGSEKWKWETARTWRSFADKHNKKLHIGRVGTLENLISSRDIGADSVDSTSFVRNESWHILEQYYGQEQLFPTISICREVK
jgi:hypothetical protein